MKKTLLLFTALLMAATLSISTSQSASAQANPLNCSTLANGDELCVRTTGKHICIYINGEAQGAGCEDITPPTGGSGSTPGVPCDFHEANCPVLDLPWDVVYGGRQFVNFN